MGSVAAIHHLEQKMVAQSGELLQPSLCTAGSECGYRSYCPSKSKPSFADEQQDLKEGSQTSMRFNQQAETAWLET